MPVATKMAEVSNPAPVLQSLASTLIKHTRTSY